MSSVTYTHPAESPMVGTPSDNPELARYQTESKTIFGIVEAFDPDFIEGEPVEYGNAISTYSGCRAKFRNIIVARPEFRAIKQIITVYADQSTIIPELRNLERGDLISVVATAFTSKSGRFKNCHRVWSVLDTVESQAVRELKQSVRVFGAGYSDPEQVLLPAVDKLLMGGSHPKRLCLNRWDKYLP